MSTDEITGHRSAPRQPPARGYTGEDATTEVLMALADCLCEHGGVPMHWALLHCAAGDPLPEAWRRSTDAAAMVGLLALARPAALAQALEAFCADPLFDTVQPDRRRERDGLTPLLWAIARLAEEAHHGPWDWMVASLRRALRRADPTSARWLAARLCDALRATVPALSLVDVVHCPEAQG